MTTTLEVPSAGKLKSMHIIDADSHLTEPHDLWLKRAPAEYRDRVPQVKKLNGKDCWVLDGHLSIGDGANASAWIRPDGTKGAGMTPATWTIDMVHPASYSVKPRLEWMDSKNIYAQIVYPNILGFGGQHTAKIHPQLRLLCVQIFNDAMAELQEESGQRLFPMAMLPWWDVKASAEEMRRAAKMGLRGVNINSDPHTHKAPDGKMLPALGDPTYWNELWEVCCEYDLPVNFHIGASEQSMDWFGQQAWPGTDPELHAGLGGAMLFFNNSRTMSNLIYSGLLDRFPQLKFVSVESGVGWIPVLLESLDYQYMEITQRNKLKRMPSEYFATNIYACFWFERKNIAHSLRAVGIDNCMFETDFPHPTGVYPVERESFLFPGLTEAETRKVVSENAQKLYRIPIPKD